jgi:hypothetical protein
LVERPGARIAGLAAAVAAMVDHDYLRDIGEGIEIWAHAGMIETRPAMHRDERWLLDKFLAVDFQFFADDIEENALIVDGDEHVRSFYLVWKTVFRSKSPPRAACRFEEFARIEIST